MNVAIDVHNVIQALLDNLVKENNEDCQIIAEVSSPGPSFIEDSVFNKIRFPQSGARKRRIAHQPQKTKITRFMFRKGDL